MRCVCFFPYMDIQCWDSNVLKPLTVASLVVGHVWWFVTCDKLGFQLIEATLPFISVITFVFLVCCKIYYNYECNGSENITKKVFVIFYQCTFSCVSMIHSAKRRLKEIKGCFYPIKQKLCFSLKILTDKGTIGFIMESLFAHILYPM